MVKLRLLGGLLSVFDVKLINEQSSTCTYCNITISCNMISRVTFEFRSVLESNMLTRDDIRYGNIRVLSFVLILD